MVEDWHNRNKMSRPRAQPRTAQPYCFSMACVALCTFFAVLNAKKSGMMTRRFAADLEQWNQAELAMLVGDAPIQQPASPSSVPTRTKAATTATRESETRRPTKDETQSQSAPLVILPRPADEAHPTSNEPPPLDRLFLKGDELTIKDMFSASWWERIDRFLDFDAENEINIVEDDSFKPILKAGHGHADVRMTRDLLDFCVEHLSKWWKDAGGETPAYARDVLFEYTQRIQSQSMHPPIIRPPQQDEYMNTTIAVIPYGVKDESSEEMMQLWGSALAATMTSLLNHGVARIVVVGYYQTDAILARTVFEQLSGTETPWQPTDDHTHNHFETKVGSSEIAFVHTDHVKSMYVSENIPKGALVGLQDALAGRSANPSPYLGDASPDRFQYVFLTESDQILHARITPDFLAEMDKGRILVPHRGQPMPHPDDLKGLQLSKSIKSLPGHKKVMALDSASDSCCDTGYHQEGYQKVCNSHWFRCDYGKLYAKFSHLDEYEFISLSQGTRVVLLAGNQHSRKCTPVKGGRGKC